MWRFLAALGLALGVGGTDLTARGGGGCVAAGTLIDTPSGRRTVESLRIGDAVWSLQAGRRIQARVRAVYEVDPAEYLELSAAGGTLRLTAEHPVQTAPGVFTRAELLTGQSLLFTTSASSMLTGLRRTPADQPAYNLLVSPGGVFFANGFLVHNKGCFLPDTPITMADGSRRSIGEVMTGDRVLAFTPDGLPAATTVRRILTHQVDSYLVVRTATTELHVTEEHPFYVGGGVFQTIDSLRIGDAVQAYDGVGRFTAQRILALERRRDSVTVYNLEVDSPHTFIASGMAVHNKGGGGGGRRWGWWGRRQLPEQWRWRQREFQPRRRAHLLWHLHLRHHSCPEEPARCLRR
ncbi:MAG: hypothetical protein IPN11_01465 [Opitutaceae bacterium]|nr:hypothetical protein [Opitutaceae bacterium]